MRTLLATILLGLVCSCSDSSTSDSFISDSGVPERPVSSEPRIDGSTEASFYASVPRVAKSVEGTAREALFVQATRNAFQQALDAQDPNPDGARDEDLKQASETLRRTVRESLHGLTADQAIERFLPGAATVDTPR